MNDLPAQMDRIARFFDAEYAWYDDDLDALESYAEFAGGPLLELGCGTGRALVSLAEAGYDVVGVESSAAMLEIARAKIALAGVADRVKLIHGDFSAAPLAGPYPFAFTLMNTFLHLPDTRSQLAALRHWRDALAPEGILLIDVFNPDVAELAAMDGKLEWERDWDQIDPPAKVMKFLTRLADPAAQMVAVKHIYDEIAADGSLRRSVASFDLRYLWRYEAELLLDQAGFDLESIYGDWGMSGYDSASERMILVARKRE